LRQVHTPESVASPLTGRLFDESGQRLTPSHTVKGERRSRYYVSRNLINGTADSIGRGWRLPAPEIERTVAAAACQILNDQTAIADAALAIGLAEHQLPSLFSLAAASMKRQQSEVEEGSAWYALVDRVHLTDTGSRVSLKVPIASDQHGANVDELVITRVFPMTIRRRGFEMRLFIDGNRAPAPRADPAFMKAIARARQWSDDLLAGRVGSVAEIAARTGLAALRATLDSLAFLAPEIVEAIATGQQPPELSAKALTETG
jgi:site-specific DNA recombinase